MQVDDGNSAADEAAAAKVIEEALGREMLLSGGYFRNTDDVIAENILIALADAGFEVVPKANESSDGVALRTDEA